MFTAANIARVGRAWFALVILLASLAEAHSFGPRTVIGNNYQQTSNTLSLNGRDQSNCINASTCYVLFQRAPNQKGLIVQHVSCRVTVSSGQLLYGNLGSLKGNTLPQKATYLAPVPTTAPWWGVNNPAMHLLKSGEKAVIRFASSQAGNWVIYCNISGQLKQP